MKLWFYLLFFCILFLVQKEVLGFISYAGSLNVMLKIITGATIMWILKDKFRYTYLNILFFFALISIPLYFLGLTGINIPNLAGTKEPYSSIFIYCTQDNPIRNSGPFWEPGAFACYLILVFLLFLDFPPNFLKKNWGKVLIIIVALLTTLSTTGYICLALIIGYYLMKKIKYKFLSYTILLPTFIFITYTAYNKLDFMQEKMEEQYEYGMEKAEKNKFSNTRFGSLFFDLYYIQKHPLSGNGLHERTRYADHPQLWGKSLGHGNGFSNYIAQMGIVAMILYLLLIFNGWNFRFWDRIASVLIIIALLQGEQLLNYPLCLALPFIRNRQDIRTSTNSNKLPTPDCP